MKGFKIICWGLSALSISACSSLQLLNWSVPTRGYSVDKDRAFGDLPRQKLDVYVPDDVAPDAPVVVFYYGGSWSSGDKSGYKFVGEALSSLGYVTVVPNYRLYPDVKYPDFMADSAAALVWAHENAANYGVSPRKVVVAGHSAGAYNAMMLAVQPKFLAAAGGDTSMIHGVISLAGPFDFFPTNPDIQDTFSNVPHKEYQPITYAKKIAPTLLLWGEADTTVLPRNSTNMLVALKNAGTDVTGQTYPEANHVDMVLALAYRFRGRADVRARMDAFIRGL